MRSPKAIQDEIDELTKVEWQTRRKELVDELNEAEARVARYQALERPPRYVGDMPEVPRQPLPAGGYLYVVEYDFNAVKIGMTANPFQRFGRLRSDANRMWRNVLSQWLSPPLTEPSVGEFELRKAASSRSSESRANEYFMGCDFEELIDSGREIAAQDAERRQQEVPA